MKFKENAIKPGMVIHCPKEEDARVLLEHLEELGFLINEEDITHPEFEWSINPPDGVCYAIESKNSLSWGWCKKSVEDDGLVYTEFSDLIEPDSPMSAVEVLEWLRNHYNNYNGKLFTEVFGADYTISELLIEKKLSPREIVDSITAYEAVKKAPKPVEVEWVDICRIIQIQDNGFKKCVYEEEIPKDAANCLGIAEEILKRYISDHDGEYIAVIEDICRAKEDE